MAIRLMAVNSDAMFLRLIAMLLEDQGMEVKALQTSEHVLDEIEQEAPDIIMLDIRLEYPDAGWDLLQCIRLDPKTRDIPVIVCSADSVFLRSKEAQLEEKGCCILEKPFELDELIATIQLLLKRRDNSAR